MAAAPSRTPGIEGLDQYYNSPIFSDIVIRAGDRRIHAHKIILSLTTPYFRGAFAGSFMESGATEMPLHDDDPEAVEGMIRFIYGIDYRDAATSPGFDYFLRIFAVADKYDVPGLVKMVTEDVRSELEREALREPSSFSQLVRSIYAETPTHRGELRSIAKETCSKNFAALMKVEHFKETLRHVPDLSVQLLEWSWKRDQFMNRFLRKAPPPPE